MQSVEDEISNHIGEVFAVTSQFAAALSKNVKLLQLVLKEHSNKPSVSLLNVMDSLVRLPAIRKTMDTMFLSVTCNKTTIMADEQQPFGSILVHFMLTREKYFIPYQKCYYLVYQSFDVDSKMCIQKVTQQCSIPQEVLQNICSMESNRLCNQSLLNYLLIELRKDKNNQKFLQAVNFLVTESNLMRAVKNAHKEIFKMNDNSDSIFSPSLSSAEHCLKCLAGKASTVDDEFCTSEVQISQSRPLRKQLIGKESSHGANNTFQNVSWNSYQGQKPSVSECNVIEDEQGLESLPSENSNTKHISVGASDEPLSQSKDLNRSVNIAHNGSNVCDYEQKSNHLPVPPSCTSVDTVEHLESEPLPLHNPAEKMSVMHNIAIGPGPDSSASGNSQPNATELQRKDHEDQQSGNKTERGLQQHYDSIARNLPDDFATSLDKLQEHLSIEQIGCILNCTEPHAANKKLVDCLVEQLHNTERVLDICEWLDKIQGSPGLQKAIEDLRKDAVSSLQVIANASYQERSVSSNPEIAGQIPLVQQSETSGSKAGVTSHHGTKRSKQKQSKNPSLDAFDQYYHLLMLINPKRVKSKLISQGFFLNGDPFADEAKYLPNDTKMEIILKEIRSCIALTGEEMFSDFVAVLLSDSMYADLGCKLLETNKALGGHVQLSLQDYHEIGATFEISTKELQEKLEWHREQLEKGMIYQSPPPLPTTYIPRLQLLESTTNAIMSGKIDVTMSTTVTLTGMGGFGKTTMAKALCHQPIIKKYFLDGFLWIKLGQHPPNPEMKLSQLYDQLTNVKLQGNFSPAEKLYCYVTNNLKRLLVIIDDVWDVNDAKIYAEVFSSCKIILTTRKNNVTTYISTKKVIKVEEMSFQEAVQLLTFSVTDAHKVNSSEEQTLKNLATDLHRWPILLSLVRNQLCEHVQMQSSFSRALHKVQQALHSKGLTAFDNTQTSKETAVKASVDATLELLTKPELSNLKTIVLYAGFGVYIPKALLQKFWDGDVEYIIQKFWSCGLIILTKLVLAPSKARLSCVEMHAVIAQYLVDNMDFGTLKQIILNYSVANIQSVNWSLNPPEEDFIEFENEDDLPEDSENPSNAIFHLHLQLGFMDNLGIPILTQKLVILTKIVQQNIAEQIKLLSEQFQHSHTQLYPLLTQFEKSNDFKSATGSAYLQFVKIYKEMKPLLSFDNLNYSSIISMLKTFLKQHPIGKIEFEYFEFLQKLVQQCNGDADAIAFINENTSYKEEQDIGVQSLLPILERQIKLRYKFVTLLNSNCTFITYLETVMDMCFDNTKLVADTVGGMSQDVLQYLDTADNEIKPVIDAVANMLSERFNQDPQSRLLIASHFNIHHTLPPAEFAVEMMRSYFQSMPI